MKKFSLLVLVAGAFIFTSCGALKSYVANYSVGLATVESPAYAKKQFGETKVVCFNEEGVSKYRYEDDYIDIVWYVGLICRHITRLDSLCVQLVNIEAIHRRYCIKVGNDRLQQFCIAVTKV